MIKDFLAYFFIYLGFLVMAILAMLGYIALAVAFYYPTVTASGAAILLARRLGKIKEKDNGATNKKEK